MRHLLGLGVRSMQSSQSLVGIAQQPEGHARYAVATHDRVVPIEDSERAMLLRIVEREALLQVRVRKAQFAQQESRGPQRMVRLQQARRVVPLLRQLQTLLAQLARRLVLPPPVIELPESSQDGEERGRLAHALT